MHVKMFQLVMPESAVKQHGLYIFSENYRRQMYQFLNIFGFITGRQWICTGIKLWAGHRLLTCNITHLSISSVLQSLLQLWLQGHLFVYRNLRLLLGDKSFSWTQTKRTNVKENTEKYKGCKAKIDEPLWLDIEFIISCIISTVYHIYWNYNNCVGNIFVDHKMGCN